MADCCTTNADRNDLIATKAAWVLWYIPAAVCLETPFGRYKRRNLNDSNQSAPLSR